MPACKICQAVTGMPPFDCLVRTIHFRVGFFNQRDPDLVSLSTAGELGEGCTREGMVSNRGEPATTCSTLLTPLLPGTTLLVLVLRY
jgi:hypothetical protein